MMFISRAVDVFLQKNPQARDGNLVTAKENMVRVFPPAAIKVFFSGPTPGKKKAH